MFNILIWDNQATLDEIFYDIVREAKNPSLSDRERKIDFIIDEYEKYSALHRIYTRMDELKYDKLDWARGVKDGIFSLVNYYQIPALKEFRDIGNKDFLDNYPKEEYTRGEQVIKDLEEKYKD